MRARHFNFTPKFSPKWGFLALNFALLDDNFPARRRLSDNFLTVQNLEGGAKTDLSASSLLPKHDVTERNVRNERTNVHNKCNGRNKYKKPSYR